MATTAVAAPPGYVRTALAGFSPEVPSGWAYTLTTVRNDEARTTARFDPVRPPADQWTLLEINGRPPTTGEAAQYAKARGAGNASTPAVFRPADIDPASYELVREDEVRAEYRCTFRAEATGADKMLGHLILRLTVNKRQPHVERFLLELKEPYSPVLGVKMRELRVQTHYSPPAPDGPGLPATSTSYFLGRIFLIGMEEDLRLTYTDFVHVN